MTQTFKQCTLSENSLQSIHVRFGGVGGEGRGSRSVGHGAPLRDQKQSGSAICSLGLMPSSRKTVTKDFKGPRPFPSAPRKTEEGDGS